MMQEHHQPIEHVLASIDKCFAFQIPPQGAANGHRAETWPIQPSWCGKMVLSCKGETLFVKLVDPSSGQVFAICPVERQTSGGPTIAVQKTLDSSRYFVLRIVDFASGRHAFIGIAFDSRSDAFDFNVTIDDHLKQLDREKVSSSSSSSSPGLQTAPPPKDYSLKKGETMHIALRKSNKPVQHSFDDWEAF